MSEIDMFNSPFRNPKLAVIGLGYVGLPLAVEFGKYLDIVGYDINVRRIEGLQNGHDTTLEVSDLELKKASRLSFSSSLSDLEGCNTFIITVPTPIDDHNRPDLEPLTKASRAIGAVLKRGDVVIYESTVYPGATEEVCVPVLEDVSGLKFNVDFYVGYSPERINPGDKTHRLPAITKVTSGSTPEAAEFVNELYASIITAGTYKAPSIRVAEAAKVIENTQRDLNIALINELAIIFNKLGIETHEVLRAAGTKWNFLPFRPGLVGGHCIGVDPYYLTHKAQAVGYHPEIVLAGRRINDGMASHVVNQLVKLMIQRERPIKNAKVLVLGLAFKENCPDLRNTKVIDLITGLKDFGMNVDVHDPWIDNEEAQREYNLSMCDPSLGDYDCIVLAVSHDVFIDQGVKTLRCFGREGHIFYDLKSSFSASETDGRL